MYSRLVFGFQVFLDHPLSSLWSTKFGPPNSTLRTVHFDQRSSTLDFTLTSDLSILVQEKKLKSCKVSLYLGFSIRYIIYFAFRYRTIFCLPPFESKRQQKVTKMSPKSVFSSFLFRCFEDLLFLWCITVYICIHMIYNTVYMNIV